MICNMRTAAYIPVIFVLTLGFFLAGCRKNDTPPDEAKHGRVFFEFLHHEGGAPVLFDTLIYENEAGNKYLVNEIQYFISDVTLHYQDGSSYLIDGWKDIHYVDTDIETTHNWDVFDDIPAGTVNRITFVFGIREEKNQSLMFTDPPESLMFWPEYLGGGYHYLKLNGKWETPEGFVYPFDFHLGIGQVYDNTGNITGFIQNWFTVELKGPVLPSFSVGTDETILIQLIMNIGNWFRGPHTYDHNDWGGDIMQKQEAMILGIENGQDVFTVGEIIKAVE